MQIELRLVAHLSQDAALLEVLSQAGPAGDAFSLLASRWLRKGSQGSPLLRTATCRVQPYALCHHVPCVITRSVLSPAVYTLMCHMKPIALFHRLPLIWTEAVHHHVGCTS